MESMSRVSVLHLFQENGYDNDWSTFHRWSPRLAYHSSFGQNPDNQFYVGNVSFHFFIIDPSLSPLQFPDQTG
jgi:hypothetical protein